MRKMSCACQYLINTVHYYYLKGRTCLLSTLWLKQGHGVKFSRKVGPLSSMENVWKILRQDTSKLYISGE